MPNVPARHRTTVGLLAALAATIGAVLGITLGTATPDAQAQTSPSAINSIVVRMQGEMRLKFDKAFIKTLKRSGATVQVKSGAKYSSKTRLARLPVDSTVAVTFDPADADILATGSVAFRRKDKRNVTVKDITLRIRAAGADVSGTVRGRPSREFAALTLSPTTNIASTANGSAFVDLQMLVSPDLAKAARQAKIKGVKEGALLGLLTAEVAADLPTFQLPSISLPGFDPATIPGIDLPTSIDIPGIGTIGVPTS